VTATLSIQILANAAAAKKAFAETTDSAESLGDKMSGMGKAMVAAAGVSVAGVVAMGVAAFNAAEESARIGRETERVIRTTGAAAWTSADQVSALAGAISDKSGADDEAIQSGANLLLTFTNVQNAAGEGNDVFDQATQAALDMSTALGTDMSSSAIQLGKALNDPIKGITALTRSGVSFTEQQRTQISAMVEAGDVLGAQKVILGEVQREFGGAAEAAGTPLDKLKVQVGNLQEAIGGALIPIVSTAATVIGDNMGPAIGKATQFLADHSEAVKFLATVGLAGLALAYGPVVAAQALLVAKPVIGFVTGVVDAVTYMGQAFLTVAAQQGILAASTQALSYAFATLGPALLIGGALYALVSAMDTSSASAEKFWESMQKQVDLSSLESIRQTTSDVEGHIRGLRRTIDQGSGFGDLAASAADLLIPFHDVENSLRDQQNEVTTLNQKESERALKVAETSNALQAYADTQAGVNESNRTAAVYWDQNAQLMSDAELAAVDINTQLQAIATSKKIELTSDDAVARVEALYQKTQFATTSTLGMSEAQEKYNDAASTAKDKVDAYKMSLDALTGAHMGAAQAETHYSQNSLSLLTTLNANRAIANGLTDASQASTLAQTKAVNDNNAAIQGNVKAAIDLANAKYQETGSIDLATASLATNREALINTMVQTGYTREAAELYVNRLGLTPAAINTQVNLNNAQANKDLADTQQKLISASGVYTATIHADTNPAEIELNKFINLFKGSVNEARDRALAGTRSVVPGAPGPILTPLPVGVSTTPGISGHIVPAATSTAPAPAAGGGGGAVNNFYMTFQHTGLAADSPALQRDVVDAIRRYETRNGPVRRAG
jgi:hypothetical protein